MKIIGITGGVGSGKSEVLRYLGEKYGAVVCEADLVAKNLQKKGTICYNKIVEHFGEDILDENGRIDRPHLAQIVFKDDKELHVLNTIVHPAVKENIRRKIRQERKQGTELFILEAALLLEEHYEKFCDKVWYVHTDREIRISRLMENRGYSREKSESIISSQAPDEYFAKHADYIIRNNGDIKDTWLQVEEGIRLL